MENKLTNEELAKVFALYLPCSVKCKKLSGWQYSQKTAYTDIRFYVENGDRIDTLILTPLESISNEDTIEVVGGIPNGYMLHSVSLLRSEFGEEDSDFVFAKQVTFKRPKTNGSINNEGFEFKKEVFSYKHFITSCRYWQYQYLISKGYSVPLFFGVNHWANGKTAIELGIAIDKTKSNSKC